MQISLNFLVFLRCCTFSFAFTTKQSNPSLQLIRGKLTATQPVEFLENRLTSKMIPLLEFSNNACCQSYFGSYKSIIPWLSDTYKQHYLRIPFLSYRTRYYNTESGKVKVI